MKDIKIFLKKRKKSCNMVLKVKKISQKMKTESLLNKEKSITEWEKCFIIRKYLNLDNFATNKKKYKQLFSFALMFEKFAIRKKI